MKSIYKHKQPTAAILACSVLILGAVAGQLPVSASHLNGQIDELNQANTNNSQSQAALEIEALGLKQQIERLQTEILGLQAQISETESKQAAVQTKISEAEAELEKQKELLGYNIRAMYIEGDISTLEMLASSKDLSQFLDKQQYRSSVQEKIRQSLDAIVKLKAELKDQKATLDKLLADQKEMQSRLDVQQAEQNHLLGLNESQQATYEQSIKQNNAQIAELKRQQAAENARLFGTTPGTGANCGGGYPGSSPGPWGNWGCNYPLDNTIDNWGMYNRECVSYTAYKVAASGRYMPYWGGIGNAKQWDDNARAAKIPTNGNPQAGDVGISNSGTYGHAFYVEQVANDGSIYISDYNQQFDGRYREYWISAETVRARGFVFIHF